MSDPNSGNLMAKHHLDGQTAEKARYSNAFWFTAQSPSLKWQFSDLPNYGITATWTG